MVLIDQHLFQIDLIEKLAEKSFTCNETQTDPYTIVHRGNQSNRHRNAIIQTDVFIVPEASETLMDSACSSDLQDFLNRVSPLMCSQLIQNTRSRAWRIMEASSLSSKIDKSETTTKTLHLGTASKLEHSVTCVGWNLTGSLIAAGYGHIFHESWCTHTSYLALWNISQGFTRGDEPNYVFEANSCINCVSFNSQNTSLLACGTFSGDIMIWTLANELDNLVANCGGADGGHQDTVSQLTWIATETGRSFMTNEYHLVSFGADGRIICWALRMAQENSLKPVKIFQVSGRDQLGAIIQDQFPPSTHSSISSTDAGGSGSAERPLGITSAVFSPHSPQNLLITTESGGLLCCNFEISDWKTPNIETILNHRFPSPVRFVLARFSAPIHCVTWSPFHRNFVAAAGAFQGIHLYNFLERTRLLTIDSNEGQTFGLQFSPINPLLLMSGCETGVVVFFNIHGSCENSEESNLTLDRNNHTLRPSITRRVELPKIAATRANPILAIAFNQKLTSFVGVGDENGFVHILDISGLDKGGPISNKIIQLEKMMENIDNY